MTTDAARLRLSRTLERVLGEEEAATLLSMLPPFEWHEIATKTDLRILEERMGARFDRVDARFEAIDARFEGRFEGIEGRFEGIDVRFRAVDARFDGVHERIEGAKNEVLAVIRGELVATVTQQTRAMVFTMLGAVVSLMAFALAFTRLA